MKSKLTLSVVVLGYSHFDMFSGCIKELLNDPVISKSEIIIVDQSDDLRFMKLCKKYPNYKFRFLKLGKNLGLEGWNRGCEVATGDILLVIDDDSYQLSDSVQKALNYFENNSKLGIIAPKVINPNKSIQWPRFYDKSTPTVGFTGNAWFIRNKLFKEIGYYPSEYFMFFNEWSIAPLILDKGYNIMYYDNVEMFHFAPPNKRLDDWRIYYYVRNYMWCLLRFDPIYLIPISFLYGLMEFSIKTVLFGISKKRFLEGLYDGVFKRPKRLKRQACYSTFYFTNRLRIMFCSFGNFLKRQ